MRGFLIIVRVVTGMQEKREQGHQRTVSKGGGAHLTSWVGNMVKTSKTFKEKARVLDEFIYLVYGTMMTQKDLERGTSKTIDIADGVVMTELLDRAKCLAQGS